MYHKKGFPVKINNNKNNKISAIYFWIEKAGETSARTRGTFYPSRQIVGYGDVLMIAEAKRHSDPAKRRNEKPHAEWRQNVLDVGARRPGRTDAGFRES